jgi:hyperosmotically inducible protein
MEVDMKRLWWKISIFILLPVFYGCKNCPSPCTSPCTIPYEIYKVAVDERDISTQIKDKTINSKILAQYLKDDSVKVLDISASCYEGHVYLVGEYESALQKKQAINIAKSVEGVKSITTYLHRKKYIKGCGTTDNLNLASHIKAALVEDKNIWATNVEVTVVQCKAVLLGIVGSYEEIDKSITLAKGVKGVRGVKSFLNVLKKSSDA